jgi:hypothetical protein
MERVLSRDGQARRQGMAVSFGSWGGGRGAQMRRQGMSASVRDDLTRMGGLDQHGAIVRVAGGAAVARR